VGGCGKAYTMQAVADPARLKTNPRPKWPVPEEVIEWQPSYVQRGAQISFNIQYVHRNSYMVAADNRCRRSSSSGSPSSCSAVHRYFVFILAC